MKLFSKIFTVVALLTAVASAQFLSQAPSIEKDAKGVAKKINYGITLGGISDPGILLSHFSQRPLLVYYYSPKCPHCQQSYPKFLAVLKDFESKGLQGIAISVGNAKKNDIRAFMDQHSQQVPMFQDDAGKFGGTYGSGHVPMMMLVFADGTYIRYTENNSETIPQIRAELSRKLGK